MKILFELFWCLNATKLLFSQQRLIKLVGTLSPGLCIQAYFFGRIFQLYQRSDRNPGKILPTAS